MTALEILELSPRLPRQWSVRHQRRRGLWKDDRLGLPSSATLTPLNGSFAVANGKGYFRADPIAESDGATFQALDDTYARDARRVWYATRIANRRNTSS